MDTPGHCEEIIVIVLSLEYRKWCRYFSTFIHQCYCRDSNSCSFQFGIYTMGKAGHTIAQDIWFFFPLHCRIIVRCERFYLPSASKPVESCGGWNFWCTIKWQCDGKIVDVLALSICTPKKLKRLDDNIFLKKRTFVLSF